MLQDQCLNMIMARVRLSLQSQLLALVETSERTGDQLLAVAAGSSFDDLGASAVRDGEEAFAGLYGMPQLQSADVAVLTIPVGKKTLGGGLVLNAVFKSSSWPDPLPRLADADLAFFDVWQRARSNELAATALQSVIDRLAFGTALLDRTCHMLFANKAAETILQVGDALRRRAGSLSATSARDSVRLRAAIEHVVHQACENMPVIHAPVLFMARASKRPLIVTVMPASKQGVSLGGMAIVHMLDPELGCEKSLEPVCRFYQFSHVETRLASLLATGNTLSEAAEQMHIQEQTAKSCLKQIFAKTGAHRQTDLIRILLAHVPRLSDDVVLESVA
jgi:DNA-binding CsgD family transcriptional regulator